MPTDSPACAEIVGKLKDVASGCALVAITINVASLLGWALKVEQLILPAGVGRSYQPPAIIMFTLGGLGLLYLRQQDRRAVWGTVATAFTILGLAGFALIEYTFGAGGEFDRLLFPEAVASFTPRYSGRMGTIAAILGTLMGVTLLLGVLRRPAGIAYSAIASTGATLSCMMVLGYAYNANALIALDQYQHLAMGASLASFLLFVGLLCVRSQAGWMSMVASSGPAGEAARRLLPATFVVLVGLGGASVWAVRLTNWDAGFWAAASESLTIPLFFWLALYILRFVHVLDIRRRDMERAIAERDERLGIVQEAASAGAWNWDILHDKIVWSDQYARLFGLVGDDTEATASRFAARFPEENRAAVREVLTRIRYTGGPFNIEYPLTGADGSVQHVMARGRVYLDKKGRPSRAAGMTLDITELVATKLALDRARTEADRANEAKSRFLAAASHDLRQPLQSLMLFLETLEQHLRRQPVEQSPVRILDGMRRSLTALHFLLDSMLEVSRIDAGLVVPQMVEVPLAPVLRRLEAAFRSRAAAKGLALRHVATSAVVRTDPSLLEEMVTKLLDNAIRFTKRGGVVLGCRMRGKHVRILVVDSGSGFPIEEQETIFDDFHQLQNPERDRSKGLGLGLAIVRRLGRLLGHGFGVVSVLGRGSSFYIDVPAVEAPSSRMGQVVPAPATDGGQGLVVVIDDDPLIREGFRALLEGWRYEVVTAESGAEAVDQLVIRNERPQVVIADYRLRQGQLGTDAIRAVVRSVGTAIPGLIVTGDTSTERLREAKAAGFTLLHKPCAPEVLRRTVSQLMAEEG